MSIIVLAILGLITLFNLLGISFGFWCGKMTTRRESKKWTQWAMKHEDEWIYGTNLIVRENGNLYYYPHERKSIRRYLVHYGCNSCGEYGLIYAGSVVFDYKHIIWAKATPPRLQKDLINLGNRNGTIGDVYKKVGEWKFYDSIGKRLYPHYSYCTYFSYKA